MRRGTTPTLKLKLTGIEVDKLNEIYVTLEQEADHCCNQIQITKRENEMVKDVENNILEVSLSQEETLKFKQAPVEVQLRATTTDGKKIATNIAKSNVYKILLEEMI